jgi:regulator of G-protein signaling
LISWLQFKIEQDFSEEILSDTLTDATTLARLLFHLGYIVSVERHHDFEKGDYIFQAPFFLPSEIGSPSNEHYARYLLRRSYNSASKFKLLPWEITNFEMLENLLNHKWKNIEEKADKDLRFISRQAKIPSRIFKLQEERFWSVQRSMVNLKY